MMCVFIVYLQFASRDFTVYFLRRYGKDFNKLTKK